jgi:hypothetical protein
MRAMFRWVVAMLMVLCGGWAQAQTCTVSGASVASVTVTDLFSYQNWDVQGSVVFSCNRPSGNPRFPATFSITTSGVNGAASRNAASGGNTLAYSLFTNYSACNTAWSGTTALSLANALTANGDTTLTNLSVPFCMRVTTSAATDTKRPLTYTLTETITIKSCATCTTPNNVWTSSGVLTLNATIDPICKFPALGSTALAMSYTSFQAGQASNSTTMNVRCTNSTGYSVSLDATSGTIPTIGLNYTIGLGNPGSSPGVQLIGSQSGTGSNQPYSVYGTVPGGQSGTCATPAGCTQSDSRTVTIGY